MSRTFIRTPCSDLTIPADVAESLRAALVEDGFAFIHDEGQEAPHPPVLEMRRYGPAVHLVGLGGRFYGTFADPREAVRHGFATLDRQARPQPTPARARRPRGRRTETRP